MSKVQPRGPRTVVDRNGRQGTIAPDGAADETGRVLVEFEDGERLWVPHGLLREDAAGSYHLPLAVEELRQVQVDGKPLVIPVIEEQAHVARVTTTNRVQIAKTVDERVEVVDEPLLSEEVEVERVAVNRPLDAAQAAHAAEVRRDGDVLIIPLVEEVLVVEKRLMLKEEVRIRKVRRATHRPQEVRLRSEQVEVTRTPEERSGGQPPAGRTTPHAGQ